MKTEETRRDIDFWRKGHLSLAEAIDAFRIVPRLIIAGYAYLMYYIAMWYMELKPYMLEGCDVATLGEKCLVDAPTGMHTTILSIMVGAATGIFGLYAASGRKWSEGFKFWNKEDATENRSVKQPEMLNEETKDCNCK